MEAAAPLMFLGLVVFLLLGYPVAFALAANGLLFAAIGIAGGHFDLSLLHALPERVYGIVANPTLLAIPFFAFMGLILERSGMAEDLLDTIGQLFGSLKGGLAYAVVLVGGLLAATTGVVAATVIAMGLISLPVMLRYGYDKRLASGVIAASGTLAQIVPPSLVLIVLADQLGASVGDMYKGALLPGLMLVGLYLGYVFLVTLFRPQAAPAMPASARTLHGSALLLRVFTTLIPPLVLIFLVLGHHLPRCRHSHRRRCDGRRRRAAAGADARAIEPPAADPGDGQHHQDSPPSSSSSSSDRPSSLWCSADSTVTSGSSTCSTSCPGACSASSSSST
jgi:TRAP-type mannitol/chloroaromatic compound transport system permease large subunit